MFSTSCTPRVYKYAYALASVRGASSILINVGVASAIRDGTTARSVLPPRLSSASSFEIILLRKKMATLQLDISGRGLATLDGVEKFPAARSLDASSNCLVELKLLSALPELHTLNVSRNELTTLLDFAVAHTGEGEGTAVERAEAKDGEAAAISYGSRLEVADLSFNRIAVLRDLSHHKFLTRLNLASNALTSVRGLRGLQYLRFLDLSKNAISTLVEEGGSDGVGAVDGLGLVELRLEHNAIENLAALGSLPRLQTLTVAENQIASMRGLDGCPSLVELDIRSNRVSEVVELARLVSGLRALRTVGNPMNDEGEFFWKPK